MRGFLDTRGFILYGILIILVISFMPGWLSLNNQALTNIEGSNPAFLVVALIPILFFARYLFIPVMRS